MPKIVTKDDFIHRSLTIHHGKYQYNKVEYVDTKTKVIITCPIHGDFTQRPYSHLEGRKCPNCNWEGKKIKTVQKLIKQAELIHSKSCTYNKIEYVDPNIPVIITCSKHGDFKMRLLNHAAGQKCPLCGSGKHRTTEDFVTLAREVHGDRYDYSLVDYASAKKEISIICPKHGPFTCTAERHLGPIVQGCPLCKASKGEQKVYRTLLDLGVTDFICEKIFDNCVAPDTNLPLRFDFYLPNLNLLIEYDGQAHFQKVQFSNTLTEEKMSQRLKRTQQLDDIKNQFAEANGISLLRIPFWKFHEIHMMISQRLCEVGFYANQSLQTE